MKEEIPPYHFLLKVLRSCPRAGMTYVRLWNEQDERHMVHVKKENFRANYLMSPTKFRNDLYALADEGLISLVESEKSISIELTAWEDVVNEEEYVFF